MDVNEELKFLRKFKKKKIFFFFFLGGDVGGQGGCDRRIEVFGKIQNKKKMGGGGGWVGGVGGLGWM